MDQTAFTSGLKDFCLIEKLIAVKKLSGGYQYTDVDVNGNPIIFSTNFNQNAKALSASFSPKQNLNGFDHPWAGGTGKNLVGDSLLTYGKSINGSGVIVDYSAYRCATMNPIIVDNTKSYVISSASSDVRVIYAVYNGSTFIRRTANVTSGTVLNISGGDRVYLCFYVYDSSRASGSQYDYRKVSATGDEIQFEQGSTPTSYERYDNLCPINGIDGITVLRTDENLIGSLPKDTFTDKGVTYVTQGNTIVATRTAKGTSQAIRYVSVPNTLAPGNYYFFGKTHYDGVNMSSAYIWDITAASRAKKWDGTLQNDSDAGEYFGSPYEFKVEEGHAYTFCCRVFASAPIGSEHIFMPTIFKADSPLTAISVEFGNTQYGGSLNVKTGELTITDAEIASYNGEALPSTWISDRDEYKAGTTPSIGAQVVYKLATPITYQFSPQQLSLLNGVNVIYTSSDGISLTYQTREKKQ